MKIFIKKYLLFLLSLLFIFYSLIFCDPQKTYQAYRDKDIYRRSCKVFGTVDSIDCRETRKEIILRKVKLKIDKKEFSCSGLIFQDKDPKRELKPGMKIEAYGTLSLFPRATNPGEFDPFLYHYIRNIELELKDPVIKGCSADHQFLKSFFSSLKSEFQEKIKTSDKSVHKTVSGVVITMLLADDSGLDRDLRELYQKNGISHILAVSGLHIWMIGGGLYRFLRKSGVHLRFCCICSALCLTVYILTIGFYPSAFRAYIMFLLYLLSIFVKRTYHLLSSCSLSMIISLVLNQRLIFHPGFILSYSALFSIIFLYPFLSEIIKNKILSKSGFTLSLALQLGMFPVISFFFYEISPYAVFLNLLVIPLVFSIIFFGILSCLSGFISASLSSFFLFLSGIFIRMIHWVSSIVLSKFPVSVFCTGKPGLFSIFLYYVLLFGLLFIIRYVKRKMSVLVLGTILILSLFLYRKNDQLVVTVLDIGQGDAIVIEISGDIVILVDGGSSNKADGGKKIIESFLKSKGYQKLNLHILTHSDRDHLSGIENMIKSGYRVDGFILPEIYKKDQDYLEFERLAKNENIRYFSKNDKIIIGEIGLYCLNPVKNMKFEKNNEYSMVLALNYKNFDLLLTGDLEGRGETEILKPDLKDMDVLKVAHHGSGNSTKEDFLDEIRTKYALISCGRNNLYGHPHKELLERLQNRGIKIFRTDLDGAITLSSNGEYIKIKTFLP